MSQFVEPKNYTPKDERARGNGDVRKPARVLVAEDERSFRAMLVWALENEGLQVVTAKDGPTLLEMLATSWLPGSGVSPFDLVVSDMRMPGWSGLSALEELCRSPLVPPIVVITAFGSEEVHQRAEHAGAAGVLDKPFDLAELASISRRVLATHAA